MCSVARCGQRWTQLTSGPLGHCPWPAGWQKYPALPLGQNAAGFLVPLKSSTQMSHCGGQVTAEMPDWKPLGSVRSGEVRGWWDSGLLPS